MKSKMRPFIILVLTFYFILSMVSAKEISNLNSYGTANISTKIYEKIFVDFDHTYNEWYISTNKSFYLNFTHQDLFQIWDLSIEIDGSQVLFDPRPIVNDKNENKPYYYAIIDIPINDSYEHDVVVTFYMTNVKSTVSAFWYPFDKYEIFLTNRTIKEDVYRIAQLNFPEPDARLTEVESSLIYEALCPISGAIKRVDSEKLIETQFTRITSGIGVKDGELNIIKGVENYKGEDYNCSVWVVMEKGSYQFNRSFFPSQFLFWIIVVFITYITYYTYYNETKRDFCKTIYLVYVSASVLLIVAEFTVAVLPPSRPLTITLFDLTIFLPFLTIAVIEVLLWLTN